ncbi:hypothetical protein [Nocardia terpenica]|uniref:t-SNARE coiled-coil homology domain-containing protein n=1 Tax=Nocardia terpenica TaxID=455432 RepID=A0A6G9Z5F5_9NOCA|nr:hypothetical protein [Nocardia terpenica]QIS20758.1 hypothetical protein F6W96_23035 [Nocardia terpenica]
MTTWAQLEARVAALEADRSEGRSVLSAVHALSAKIDANQERNESGFATLHTRFDGLETKVDGLETRFDGLETRFDGLETRFDGLETRFDGLETKVDGLETRFDGLETRFDGLETRFDGLETRFDGLDTKVDGLDTKVDGLDTKVDTLEVKAEVQRNVTNALGQRTWEMSKKLDEHIAKCDATNERLFGEIAILRGGQRSLDESNAELKDLMLQVLDRGTRTEFGGE